MAKTLSTKEVILSLCEVWERQSGPQTNLGYGDDEPFHDRLMPEVKGEKDLFLAMRQAFGMLHDLGWPYGQLMDVAMGYLRDCQDASIEITGHDEGGYVPQEKKDFKIEDVSHIYNDGEVAVILFTFTDCSTILQPLVRMVYGIEQFSREKFLLDFPPESEFWTRLKTQNNPVYETQLRQDLQKVLEACRKERETWDAKSPEEQALKRDRVEKKLKAESQVAHKLPDRLPHEPAAFRLFQGLRRPEGYHLTKMPPLRRVRP